MNAIKEIVNRFYEKVVNDPGLASMFEGKDVKKIVNQ
jgi:truncated hemoglobin YjbI